LKFKLEVDLKLKNENINQKKEKKLTQMSWAKISQSAHLPPSRGRNPPRISTPAYKPMAGGLMASASLHRAQSHVVRLLCGPD
jgi:hypothetical protein